MKSLTDSYYGLNGFDDPANEYVEEDYDEYEDESEEDDEILLDSDEYEDDLTEDDLDEDYEEELDGFTYDDEY